MRFCPSQGRRNSHAPLRQSFRSDQRIHIASRQIVLNRTAPCVYNLNIKRTIIPCRRSELECIRAANRDRICRLIHRTAATGNRDLQRSLTARVRNFHRGTAPKYPAVVHYRPAERCRRLIDNSSICGRHDTYAHKHRHAKNHRNQAPYSLTIHTISSFIRQIPACIASNIILAPHLTCVNNIM